MTSLDQLPEIEEDAATPEEKARSAVVFGRLDMLVAVIFIALGGVILQQIATKLPLMRFGQVGPGMLPFGVAAIFIVMGLLIIVQNLRGAAATSGGHMPNLREGGRVIALIALVVGATILMPYLGTVTALALFILVETRFLEGRRWPVAVAAAVLVPLFIYVSFEALLGVPLPKGMLGLI
jgi:putative tricarboxylic transport membrane protein